MKYRELLKEGERTLLAAGVEESGLDAWYLFSDCFAMDKSTYLLYMETELTQEKEKAARKFWKLVNQRKQRIPLQQLLQNQEFMGLPFFVNEHVLIPRQDTEVLVETVLSGEKEFVKKVKEDGTPAGRSWRILDLCTGSGCIGLSLAAYFRKEKNVEEKNRKIMAEGPEELEIVLSDISMEALKVAEENIRRLDLADACRLVRSDLFEALEKEQFDCIVSNPPYISKEELGSLSPEVKDHEPGIALDGGPDGLAFYRRISKEAAKHLLPDGRLYLEIGWDQGESVQKFLRSEGFFHIDVIKDLAGRDRVVKAVRPE